MIEQLESKEMAKFKGRKHIDEDILSESQDDISDGEFFSADASIANSLGMTAEEKEIFDLISIDMSDEESSEGNTWKKKWKKQKKKTLKKQRFAA